MPTQISWPWVVGGLVAAWAVVKALERPAAASTPMPVATGPVAPAPAPAPVQVVPVSYAEVYGALQARGDENPDYWARTLMHAFAPTAEFPAPYMAGRLNDVVGERGVFPDRVLQIWTQWKYRAPGFGTLFT